MYKFVSVQRNGRTIIDRCSIELARAFIHAASELHPENHYGTSYPYSEEEQALREQIARASLDVKAKGTASGAI